VSPRINRRRLADPIEFENPQLPNSDSSPEDYALAATVKDVDPNLLLAYHELVAENPDRVRHAELLRHVAFTGKIKTATEYLSAYISDRTGGGRVA